MASSGPLPDRRAVWRGSILRIAFVLVLGCASAGLTANGAGAQPMSAGERAYARAEYVRAARLLTPEAEYGRAPAQTYLGYMFANGLGVPQDFVIAVYWLTLAAQQGSPAAQYLLGGLYDRGQGVKRDFVMAEIWLDLAAANPEPGRRDAWAGLRDAVASKLSIAELTEAQRRSAAWAAPASP